MRLIDADALIQIFEADEKALADREFQLAAIGAANTVRKMPTVDALPYEYIENLEKELLTEHDIERLMQCVTCEKSPRDCGCDDSDEDENGMCIKWERKEK